MTRKQIKQKQVLTRPTFQSCSSLKNEFMKRTVFLFSLISSLSINAGHATSIGYRNSFFDIIINSSLTLDLASHQQETQANSLHDAICKVEYETVKQLIKSGALLNDASQKITPVFSAIYTIYEDTNLTESLRILSLILQNGSSPNSLRIHNDQTSDTPLTYAARYRSETTLSTIKLLFQYGASVHATDNEGNTPLHSAAKWKNNDYINALIERGANPLLKNKAFKTPLDIALEYPLDSQDTIKLLQAAELEWKKIRSYRRKRLKLPINTTIRKVRKRKQKQIAIDIIQTLNAPWPKWKESHAN